MQETTKVALITGGSRGIGKATSILLAEHGYDICINYLSNDSAAKQVQEAVQSLGRQCVIFKGDASLEADVERMFKFVDQQLGAISALVNNAALMMPQLTIEQVDQQRLNKIFSTNISGYFLCARQAVLRMAYKHGGAGGSIVNVSSLAALTGSPNEYLDYAASKGAIDTFTRGLAKEMSREGVRVNGVRPGLIYTDMHSDGGEPNRVDRVKDNLPLGRGGEPIEVARAIYWLLCEQSSFTTGDSINVAGGMN
jgi:NAD(P)-dependent dehydrogenase (short-subunit alcohol dehydrogenase family)